MSPESRLEGPLTLKSECVFNIYTLHPCEHLQFVCLCMISSVTVIETFERHMTFYGGGGGGGGTGLDVRE